MKTAPASTEPSSASSQRKVAPGVPAPRTPKPAATASRGGADGATSARLCRAHPGAARSYTPASSPDALQPATGVARPVTNPPPSRGAKQTTGAGPGSGGG